MAFLTSRRAAAYGMMKRDMATPLFSPRQKGGYVYRDILAYACQGKDEFRLEGWFMDKMALWW